MLFVNQHINNWFREILRRRQLKTRNYFICRKLGDKQIEPSHCFTPDLSLNQQSEILKLVRHNQELEQVAIGSYFQVHIIFFHNSVIDYVVTKEITARAK